jgi:hypothetical protein
VTKRKTLFRRSDKKLSPAFEKDREFMVGTRVPVSAFYPKVTKAIEPIVVYVIRLPIPMYSKKRLVSSCAGA